MNAENSTTLNSGETPAVEIMGRKGFNSFLYDLYGCKERNTAKADIDLNVDDVYHIEIFNSPEGILIAAHEVNRVHIIRPAAIVGSSDSDAGVADALRQRYAGMTSQQVFERAIFLEGIVNGLTGKPAPDWTRQLLENVSGATEAKKQVRAMQGSAA